MPERRNLIDTSNLGYHAYQGNLYQASDAQTSIVTTAPLFALGSGASKGLPIRVISIRISASTPVTATLGVLAANPALGNGNAPVNAYLGNRAAQAQNQATTSAAALTFSSILNIGQIAAGFPIEFLNPAVLFMPPGTFLGISVPVAVQTLSVVWLWAEVPPDPLIATVGPDPDFDAQPQ